MPFHFQMAQRPTEETLVQGPPPPVPPPDRYGNWEVFAVIALALAAAAAIAAFLIVAHRHHAHHAARVVPVVRRSIVPRVVGVNLGTARIELTRVRLTAVTVPRQSQQPAGMVLAQKPRAGARVAQGSAVTLVVSRGRPGVQLPNVVGLALPAATKALSSAKLVPVVRRSASQAKPGTVLAEQPPAGARAKPGTKVVLVVAKPPATTTVQQTVKVTTTVAAQTTPATTASTSTTATTATGHDYRGMQLSQAAQKIAQGRQQVVVTYVSSSRPAGVVVSNAPAGSREQLQVSSGPTPGQPTTVPNVTGRSASDAENSLRSAGFSVLEIQWPTTNPPGNVLYETPSSTAPRGALIVLYVGQQG